MIYESISDVLYPYIMVVCLDAMLQNQNSTRAYEHMI